MLVVPFEGRRSSFLVELKIFSSLTLNPDPDLDPLTGSASGSAIRKRNKTGPPGSFPGPALSQCKYEIPNVTVPSDVVTIPDP